MNNLPQEISRTKGKPDPAKIPFCWQLKENIPQLKLSWKRLLRILNNNKQQVNISRLCRSLLIHFRLAFVRSYSQL